MKTCFINNVLTKPQRYNVNLLASNYSLITMKKKTRKRRKNIANPTNVINNNLIFVLLREDYK